MFQHQITPFGKYTQHSLRNNEGTGFSLVPEYGACFLDLSFQGTQVLDAYTTPEELDFNRWSKNVLLYPFPNRLKEGSYTWNGKTYQFPINDGQTGNALHGFGTNKPMTIAKVTLEEQQASMLLTYDYAADNPAFPFPFSFEFDLLCSNANTFEANMSFRNTGTEAMPIGWGWHPYFALEEQVDRVHLSTPTLHMIGIDQYMIPTGKRYEYPEFRDGKPIGATILDNCFAVEIDQNKISLSLQGNKGRLDYWQQTGDAKYNFIQLFTPPHRQSVAIEPMTCNVDALNNQQGLIVLEPGQEASAKFGLTYTNPENIF